MGGSCSKDGDAEERVLVRKPETARKTKTLVGG
jgi:hypothetical protein